MTQINTSRKQRNLFSARAASDWFGNREIRRLFCSVSLAARNCCIFCSRNSVADTEVGTKVGTIGKEKTLKP